MKYIVTDRHNYVMSLDTSEKLKMIEPETYEESFPFEDKLLFCYKQGTEVECREFIAKQRKNVQNCLEIKAIK